jgi:cation:H+ antiporter
LIGKLSVEQDLIDRDFPFTVISSIGLLLIAYFLGKISRLVGAIFLIVLFIYIYHMIKKSKEHAESVGEEVGEARLSIPKAAAYIVIGIAGVIIGSNFVVDGASDIASFFGLSDALIGLTVVAIGTSLPELVTSITALKKGENGMVIGNVLGSCIFNILFILGISSVIIPMPIDPEMIADIAFMTAITILGAIFAKSQKEVDKKEGFVLFALFVLYMIFIILRN